MEKNEVGYQFSMNPWNESSLILNTAGQAAVEGISLLNKCNESLFMLNTVGQAAVEGISLLNPWNESSVGLVAFDTDLLKWLPVINKGYDFISTSSDYSMTIEVLRPLDSDFVTMWYGAFYVYSSPDYLDNSRHFLASLRELMTHVLEHLGPRNEVVDWCAATHGDNCKSNCLYINNSGRKQPTRRGRLYYAGRLLPVSGAGEFESQVSFAVSLITKLNSIHRKDVRLTKAEMAEYLSAMAEFALFLTRII